MLYELPVVTVHIPPSLRVFASDCEEVVASGETVADVLVAVAHIHPALTDRIRHDGSELPSGLAVYLGARSIREQAGLQTPVLGEELVSLVAIGD